MPTAFQLKRMHVEATAAREAQQALQPLVDSNAVNVLASASGVPALKTFAFTFPLPLSKEDKENGPSTSTGASATGGIFSSPPVVANNSTTLVPSTNLSLTTPASFAAANVNAGISFGVTANTTAAITTTMPLTQRVPYVFDPALGPFGHGIDSVPLPPIALKWPRRVIRGYDACARRAGGPDREGAFSAGGIDWTLPAYLGARVCQDILDEEEVSKALLGVTTM